MHWLLTDFCFWSRTRAVHIVRFLTEHFNERVFSSILSPHSHVILHAGLARSCRIHCLMIAKKPSPQGKGARYGGWGVMERVLPRLSPIVYDGPPTPGGQGWSFRWWILQLCLRLRAEWQSVRHIAKSESFRTRETKQKEVWCYGHNFVKDSFFKGIWSWSTGRGWREKRNRKRRKWLWGTGVSMGWKIIENRWFQ